MTLVCVDMISDDANYMARYLSNQGQIEMLINIEYNPAAPEFLREASSMVMRHPLFAILANDASNGYSGIVGSLLPVQKKPLLPLFPPLFKNQSGELASGFENVLSVSTPQTEEALLYDLNLRLVRVPYEANAPDQGYPTIRNIRKIAIITPATKKQVKANETKETRLKRAKN